MRQNAVNLVGNCSFFGVFRLDRFLINFGDKIITRKNFAVGDGIIGKT